MERKREGCCTLAHSPSPPARPSPRLALAEDSGRRTQQHASQQFLSLIWGHFWCSVEKKKKDPHWEKHRTEPKSAFKWCCWHWPTSSAAHLHHCYRGWFCPRQSLVKIKLPMAHGFTLHNTDLLNQTDFSTGQEISVAAQIEFRLSSTSDSRSKIYVAYIVDFNQVSLFLEKQASLESDVICPWSRWLVAYTWEQEHHLHPSRPIPSPATQFHLSHPSTLEPGSHVCVCVCRTDVGCWGLALMPPLCVSPQPESKTSSTKNK